jgi:hypothetical protein
MSWRLSLSPFSRWFRALRASLGRRSGRKGRSGATPTRQVRFVPELATLESRESFNDVWGGLLAAASGMIGAALVKAFVDSFLQPGGPSVRDISLLGPKTGAAGSAVDAPKVTTNATAPEDWALVLAVGKGFEAFFAQTTTAAASDSGEFSDDDLAQLAGAASGDGATSRDREGAFRDNSGGGDASGDSFAANDSRLDVGAAFAGGLPESTVGKDTADAVAAAQASQNTGSGNAPVHTAPVAATPGSSGGIPILNTPLPLAGTGGIIQALNGPAATASSPVAFVEHQGQFQGQSSGFGVTLSAGGVTFTVGKSDQVQMQFAGASASAELFGLTPTSTAHAGSSGTGQAFSRVEYSGLYPATTLDYYRNAQGQVEYDWTLAAGHAGNVGQIAMNFVGADRLAVDAQGNLQIFTPGGGIVEHAPVAYQVNNGMYHQVASAYVLHGNQVGFTLGATDPTRPVVIDPTITTLYDTGVDNTGTVLADGATDPHYAITAAPSPDSAGPAYVVTQNGFPTSSPWVPENTTSKWIAPHANENDQNGGTSEPPGNYTYETTFDLTGYIPSTASITGQYSDDNTLVHVFLNGTDTGISSSSATDYTAFHSFAISSGFSAGVNTLDFVVENLPIDNPDNAGNPSGLRVEMTGTADRVPDQSLTASSVSIPSLNEGEQFSGTVATFADADPAGALGNYRATIDWGDGQQTLNATITQPGGAGNPFAVSGDHTYAEEGNYTVSVAITDIDSSHDAGGSQATATDSITVNEAPLTAATGQTIHSVEGSNSGLQVVATFQDTAPAEPLGVAIADPSFETPNVGSGSFGSFVYDPGGSPWTFTAQSTGTDGPIGSGVGGNDSGFTSGNPNAPDAAQVAFIQGTASTSQSVFMSAGTYALGFDSAQRGNYNHGGQTFEVLVDGNVVATVTPAGTSYETDTTDPFTVATGEHSIAFVGLNPLGGDNTAFIDAVTATQLSGVAVGDGGFEQPNVGTGTFGSFAYDPAGTPWTFTPEDQSLPVGSGVAGNGSGFTLGNPDAPEGTQVGFLQGAGSAISQALDFTAGVYTIGFLAAQRGDYQPGGNQVVQVLFDDAVVGEVTPAGTSYASYATSGIVVSAGTHTLTFKGLTSGDSTAFIDDVKIGLADADNVNYASTIHWGDGASSPGLISYDAGTNTFSVWGSHTYAEEGSYPVTTTIQHETAPTLTATSTALVADAPLSASGVSLTGTAGLPIGPVIIANFTDADPGLGEPEASAP